MRVLLASACLWGVACSGEESAGIRPAPGASSGAESAQPPAPPATAPAPKPSDNATTTAASTPLAASAAGQSTPEERLPPAPAPYGEVRSPEMAAKFARTDAAIDGWTSEVWNDRTGAQLKALAELLKVRDGLEESALEELIDADFACNKLRPERNESASSTASLRIARNDTPPQDDALRGIAGALEALRELRAAFDPAANVTHQFKTISVDERDGGATTRVFVFLDARESRPVRSIRATWRCEWSARGAQDTHPKLARILVEAHAESEAAAPLFEEATSAVFAGEESFQAQLAPSLEHWSGRVERALGMTLIGHEGLALGDADGDGLDDLYLCQPGGLPNKLYLRQRNGALRDHSRDAGVDFLDASRAALWCDLDNDGDQDLVVEVDPLLLVLENVGGARFVERTRVEVTSTTSISAVDFDEDGDLDLYICGYIVPDEAHVTPLPYHDANNGRPNTLLRNDIGPQGWKFVDVTIESGLDQNNRRFSFAASWEDFDDDGDPDLYVANDFGRNNLYRNDGGRFRDVAAQAGVEDMAAGMGVSWGDFDRDGRLDLYVSNMFSSAGERVSYQRRFLAGAAQSTLAGFQRHARGNTLFRNLGEGRFQDVSEQAGVTMGRWAWGSLFVEYDNDGWPDLFVPNGYVTGEDPEDL